MTLWLKCPKLGKLGKNGWRISKKLAILQILPNFSKNVWCIFFKLSDQMKAHDYTFLQWKWHFDWNAQSWANLAKTCKKWANTDNFANCLISQKLSDEFFSNRTKWWLMMTPFCSENAILIEMPEVGQIVQKRAKMGKNRQFFSMPDFSKTMWWFLFHIATNESS